MGGWAEGFLAEGFDVVGFDNERHMYEVPVRVNGVEVGRPIAKYPAQLVLQDVLTPDGRQFKDAAVIVASPPCQEYSYMAMPWTLAKQKAAWYREDSTRQLELNCLFNACFAIAHAADVPLIVENVKGAQPWVGRARWHYGSFYLWGDVPGLMPMTLSMKMGRAPKAENGVTRRLTNPGEWKPEDVHEYGSKNKGGSWFAIGSPGQTNVGQNPDGRKVPSMTSWAGFGKPGYKPMGFNVEAAWRYREENGTKQEGSGLAWFDNGLCKKSSRSDSRKAASAQIAKIPFPLAQHIARVFSPQGDADEAAERYLEEKQEMSR